MSRLPERDTRQRASEQPLQVAAQQHPDRDRLHPHLHDRPLPGLHQTRALHQLRLRTECDLRQLGQHRHNSPVRIAGVDVGKVIATERDGDATTVTFTVDGSGQPIHDDAFAAIRPRIFLEGNFFVDLDPGSPSAPSMDSGDTIPVSRTSTAVQLDEILDRPAVARARRPQPPARGLRDRADPRADRGGRRHPATRGPGPDRRRGPQQRLQVRRRRRPLQRPGDQRPARDPAARSLAPHRRRRPHLRRPRQQRGRAAGPDRQLQRLHRRPRGPVGQPLDHDPACWRRPCGPRRPRWSASTGRCRRCGPTRSS